MAAGRMLTKVQATGQFETLEIWKTSMDSTAMGQERFPFLTHKDGYSWSQTLKLSVLEWQAILFILIQSWRNYMEVPPDKHTLETAHHASVPHETSTISYKKRHTP